MDANGEPDTLPDREVNGTGRDSQGRFATHTSDQIAHHDVTVFDKHDWALTYLKSYRLNMTVTQACKAAGVHRITVMRRRKRDPEFARREKLAKHEAIDLGASEAWRRGTKGVLKPILHNGQVVAHVREYSDPLLKWMLECADRERFGKQSTMTVNQSTQPLVDAAQQRVMLSDPELCELAARITERKAQLAREAANSALPALDVTPTEPSE